MKVNHKFILEKCLSLLSADAKILDYGCGKGLIVEEGIRRGIDFYGVEAFSFGSGVKLKDYLRQRGFLDDKIKEIIDGVIPFPDHYFDFVISNQVFEHVTNLDACLVEINRVLKPGGKLLCLFSSKEVIREGHCGILFAHRFPKSLFRYYWLLLFKGLGFGRPKKQRSAAQWAAFFNNWLVDSVTYRRMDEINNIFKTHSFALTHIEDEYISFRLSEKKFQFPVKVSTYRFMRPLTRLICRKWGGLIFIAHKKINSKSLCT